MRAITLLMAFVAIVTFGCKSGEKGEIYTLEESIDKNSRVPDHHNSRTSLDWAGVYEGTTPCADCEGIKTKLTLADDETFELSQAYLGKPGKDIRFKENGKFTWDEAGSSITLTTPSHVIKFKVGENEVTMLDMSGNVVSGELANFYVLKKTSN